MSKKMTIVFLCLISSFNILFSQNNDEIKFKWGFRTIDESTNRTVIIDFSQNVKISDKDPLQIYLEPFQNTFIYLFLLDAKKELSLIFPNNFNLFNGDYFNKVYYIPDNNNWFYFDDDCGTEEFYLIGSKKREVYLEKLTKKYLLEYENKNPNQAKLVEAKGNVIDEIMRLKKSNSSILSTAEKPVSIAGTTRSLANNSTNNVTEVTADGFYVKTLRMEH